MKSLFTLLAILAASVYGYAQQGTLSGKVTDKSSGEAIIGAVVFIKGASKGTTTNIEGKYTLPLEAGMYQISVSSLSYKPAEHTNIKVDAGKTTVLNVQIEENSTEIQTVTIVGARQTNTEMALMENMRQSEVVVSGVSGEQIAKSLDRDAAETVKRIPGVTIMNDRYIVIRGMNERYNSVMLNDAFTPSTEPDAKAFSFDILPTSVIDRIMIYKNGSPELPGEFGGGVIKVYTKNVVDENSTTVSMSSSYRIGTTLNNFSTYTGSATDFLGFDNGYRTLPSTFPGNINSMRNKDQLAELGRSLPNSWGAQQASALPDLRFSLGLNRRLDIGNIRLSNISAITYSNTRLHTVGSRNKYQDFIPSLGYSPKDFTYIDEVSTQSVRVGLLHNWSARINNNNKIEFRNLLNQLGSSEVLRREGIEFFNNQEQRNYALRYESRFIYSGQLQGTHDLNNEKTSVTWTGGYNFSNRDEPDYRRFRTGRELGSADPFVMLYKNTPSLADAGRFYSELKENGITANGQIEHRFNPKDSLSENSPKIRAGFYIEQKNRNFDARFLSYKPANNQMFDEGILGLPYDQVFSEANINTTTGWEVVEGTNPSDSYTASNSLFAAYVGGSTPLGAKLSFSGGARIEYNIQKLKSFTLVGQQEEVDNPVLRVLPSANFTYNLNDKSMLRLGGSVSLNRPEFREIAPFSYYDFRYLLEQRGNPDLKTASIYNADLRYEFYPNPTELISVGVFGKYFINPIENYFEVTNIGNSLIYGNADNATSYGIEAEIRKSLTELSGSQFVQNLTLVLNTALVRSNVQLGERAVGQEKNRQMMGQSPYVVNTGIYYQDNDRKLQFNLLYNVVGRRIFLVGSYANPTVYEMPRNLLDLSITKGIGNGFELKAGVQDIFNQKVQLTQDSDRDGKITSVDDSFLNYRRGRYTTLGVNYKF